MASTQDVFAALKAVDLPDLKSDVVSAGFVRNLVISGGAVSFDLALALPQAVPASWVEQQQARCETVVRALGGVTSVHVKASATVREPKAAARAVMPEVRHVVAVASGKGGVGKSTTAANLALSLVRMGYKVGLLDADIYGPSMPTMLGVNQRPEPASDKTIKPVPAHGLSVISIGFLVEQDTPMVWRGPMVHGALTQFMEQVVWGPLDFVIVDMPPGTGDAQLTLTQKAPLSGAVIVTTPQQVSLIDARKGLKMFEQVKVPVLGIVENMSFLVAEGVEGELDLFGRGSAAKAATELGVPFLGEIPLEPAVSASGDGGTPIVVSAPESRAAKAFMALAEQVVAGLGGAAEKTLEPMAWEA
ncbi:MAG: ATP-binding protein involved in chromosome partitioning [Pseudohongiellaceae bacterium]|jgi:ATP-binding protein involved in chromosome partitioning